MKRDTYYWEFREALEKDGWTITHDAFTILTKEDGGLATDLGAEKIFIAEKGPKKIAVEIKSFLVASLIHEFIRSSGQYRAYVLALRKKEPEREMYFAMPEFVQNTLFKKEIIQTLIEDLNMRIVLFDPATKTIKLWKG